MDLVAENAARLLSFWELHGRVTWLTHRCTLVMFIIAGNRIRRSRSSRSCTRKQAAPGTLAMMASFTKTWPT